MSIAVRLWQFGIDNTGGTVAEGADGRGADWLGAKPVAAVHQGFTLMDILDISLSKTYSKLAALFVRDEQARKL